MIERRPGGAVIVRGEDRRLVLLVVDLMARLPSPAYGPMKAVAACTSREALDAAERLLIPRVCNLEVCP